MTDQTPANKAPPDRTPGELFRADVEPLAPTQEFLDQCALVGVGLDEGDADRLGRFLALMLDTNKRVNLTGIKDPKSGWIRHIFDALTLIPLLSDLPEGAKVIDVGSGGGVPAVPLAITQPRLEFTCLEATGKKAAFLEFVAQTMELENLRVVHARSESAARRSEHRDAYDAATARALGRLDVASELVLPFVKPGGIGLFVKGAQADAELADAKQALHMLHGVHAGTIATPTGTIIVIEKLRSTPKAYPRADGQPKKQPLGSG